MMTSLSGRAWVGLASILFVTTFGFTGGIWILIYLLSFLIGVCGVLYQYGKENADKWRSFSKNMTFALPSVGIPKIIEEVLKEKNMFCFDRRMTGSTAIDEVLTEILDYANRDYLQSWYRKISEDEEFNHHIRLTIQRVVIAFSERSKQVDLVPYLTTRLVDDFASHIRLYRRALEKVREQQKDDTKPPADLQATFFELENDMEKNMCRAQICMNEQQERQYLQNLSEVMMFLLLPPEDFYNKAFRYIVREVLVNGILLPTINMVAEPDYINYTISWLCKDGMMNTETFLTILKSSDNTEELQAIKLMVDTDVTRLRSKDTGGEDDAFIKQQLSSLIFLSSQCEERMEMLRDGIVDHIDLPVGWDVGKLVVPGQKLYALPFDVVLHNNVALSYFIEFMTNISAQGVLFFYLTIEGYRVSAEQQISAALLADHDNDKPDLDMLRDAALSIYNQYFSEKAAPKIDIDEVTLKLLSDRIQYDEPSDTLFDDVQSKVWDMLQEDPYFPAFKRSQLYIKLLAELDLLKDKDVAIIDIGDDRGLDKAENLKNSTEDLCSSSDSLTSSELYTSPTNAKNTSQQMTLSAQITNTGICREHGKAYAVYLITVKKMDITGAEDVWDVYRRYSDFHDLHTSIQEQFDSLSGLALPSKKTFNNMNKEFLEKRKVGLNAYLQTLLNPLLLNNHRGLLDLVHGFLEHIVWEKENAQILKRVGGGVDALVNPLKNSVRSVGNIVRSMPDNFADGVAKVSGGIKSIPLSMLDGVGKVLNVKPTASTASLPANIKAEQLMNLDSAKVGASLDAEDDQDNIPLRIMLLLMDEVFDLKHHNIWLRRRIGAILRQIIKTMLGDSINRKIVDHVESLTSAEQIAEYLKTFRDTFWPNGVLAESRPPRDFNTKMRTRVVAKTKLLSTMSDELRHLIGSETTRQGCMLIFNMFQHDNLNKRLFYVILEGALETMFPDNKFDEVFRKMHTHQQKHEETVKT